MKTDALKTSELLFEPNAFTIVFVVVFIAMTMAVGIYANKKIKTSTQYFGGTKSFGAITIALASSAAIMSAFGFIGGPGLVYKLGFSSIWITLAAGISFTFAYMIMGKRMRAMAEVADIATLPDVAKVRFQSELIRALLSVGLLIASIAYLSSQVKGGAKLITQMIGVHEYVSVAILFGTTMVYMLISGMAGSILTDAFQGFVMLLGVLAVIVGFFFITEGRAMPVIQQSQQFGPQYIDAIGKAPLGTIVTFFMVFFLGMMGQPQMLTKMYAIEDPLGLKRAGIVSGITYAVSSIVWFMVGYGAIYIVATGDTVGGTVLAKDADKAAFLFLSKLNVYSIGSFNVGIVIQAMVMTALLAAIMSTASFFVSLGSGSIIRDFLGALGFAIPQHKQIFWGRVLTFIVTIFAILFGYLGGGMVAILGTLGWGFFVSVTLPTFTLGLLWKRTSKEGVVAGLITAIVSNIVLIVLKRTGVYATPFPYYLFSICISMFITILVSFFTKTASGENLPEEIKMIFKL